MRPILFCLALTLAAPVAALAQPVQALPAPDVPAGSPVSDYLRAAEGAVAAGRLEEAEQALEMAQTRMLDRSVPLFQTHDASADPAVGDITQARQALAGGDRQACLRFIQMALESAQGA
jgi:hypothetical protein